MRGKLLYLTPNDGEILLTLNNNRFYEHGDGAVDDRQSGRHSRLNFPSSWETESNTVSLDIIQPLNEVLTFESRTGYVHSDFERDTDFDGSPGDALLFQETDEYKFNQEFLLKYDKDRVRAVTGVFFAKGKLEDAYSTDNVQAPTTDLLGFDIVVNSINAVDEEFETAALFADIDFNLTDKLTLLAGLRADYEKRNSNVETLIERNASYGVFDPTIDGFLAGLSGQQDGDESYFNLLPKLGFNYMWSDTFHRLCRSAWLSSGRYFH